MYIPSSELILNPDGSVYHLNLLPEQIASTIITVGDPDRVDTVAAYFDTVEYTVHKREFKTITGSYKGKRITVISTGIGTDNIDIVLNELDALVNIDLTNRVPKETHKTLDIIRVGTSGAIQKDIQVDSFLISKTAIGLDALLHFYKSKHIQDVKFQKAFMQHMDWAPEKSEPYVVSADPVLLAHFSGTKTMEGCTATNIGFYAPQGRKLRLETSDDTMNEKLESFRFRETRAERSRSSKITNLEMETSGIYGLASLLGHRAISLNAILANRALKTFSERPEKTTKALIEYALERIITLEN
jgi:uridine phosphorylase